MISALWIWKSFPSLLVFLPLPEDVKKLIAMDLRLVEGQNILWALHKRLLRDKVFRRIYFVRVLSVSTWKYRAIRWTYSPIDSLEIRISGP